MSRPSIRGSSPPCLPNPRRLSKRQPSAASAIVALILESTVSGIQEAKPLREFRAHRRGLDRARAELREAQEVLRQAEDFLAQHGHQINVGGLDVAHRSVEEAREAVCRRQADIDAMASPDKPVGRPYKGIWASDDEIQPAPKGAPHAEGDD